MCIATEESFYILRYSAEAVEKAKDQPDAMTEDGIEEAFDVSYLSSSFSCFVNFYFKLYMSGLSISCMCLLLMRG